MTQSNDDTMPDDALIGTLPSGASYIKRPINLTPVMVDSPLTAHLSEVCELLLVQLSDTLNEQTKKSCVFEGEDAQEAFKFSLDYMMVNAFLGAICAQVDFMNTTAKPVAYAIPTERTPEGDLVMQMSINPLPGAYRTFMWGKPLTMEDVVRIRASS